MLRLASSLPIHQAAAIAGGRLTGPKLIGGTGPGPAGTIDSVLIEVVSGDITRAKAEAVVAAANRHLAGGGGVDGAIHRAAGPQLLQALRPLAPCAVGGAVVTPAFNLPAPIRYVVHAVGPRYGVDEPADELLRDAYLAALRRCDEVGARSVAFPSISTGAYGFPLERACVLSAAALRGADTTVERCLLVAFDGRTHRHWQAALGGTASKA